MLDYGDPYIEWNELNASLDFPEDIMWSDPIPYQPTLIDSPDHKYARAGAELVGALRAEIMLLDMGITKTTEEAAKKLAQIVDQYELSCNLANRTATIPF